MARSSPVDVRVREQLEALAIASSGVVERPAGDGCNTCSCPATRVSEHEVLWSASCLCTTLHCGSLRPERFK